MHRCPYIEKCSTSKMNKIIDLVLNKSLEQKGLTSADRSNKATLLLTVPRSHSSRLQRIHPRPYFMIAIHRQAATSISAMTTKPIRFGSRATSCSILTLVCLINVRDQHHHF